MGMEQDYYHNEITQKIGRMSDLLEKVHEYKGLSKPRLTDLEAVPELASLYLDHLGMGEFKTNERISFVFIVLYLYSPASLLGQKMPVGLRGTLADVFGVSVGQVSVYAGRCLFFYEVYAWFRQNICDGLNFLAKFI